MAKNRCRVHVIVLVRPICARTLHICGRILQPRSATSASQDVRGFSSDVLHHGRGCRSRTGAFTIGTVARMVAQDINGATLWLPFKAHCKHKHCHNTISTHQTMTYWLLVFNVHNNEHLHRFTVVINRWWLFIFKINQAIRWYYYVTCPMMKHCVFWARLSFFCSVGHNDYACTGGTWASGVEQCVTSDVSGGQPHTTRMDHMHHDLDY